MSYKKRMLIASKPPLTGMETNRAAMPVTLYP
jgi:hypothetical protein